MPGADMREALKPRGRVDFIITKGTPKLILGKKIPGYPNRYESEELDLSGCEVLKSFTLENIVVNAGKDQIIKAIGGEVMPPITRMAVGDNGALPSDITVPKVPTAARTGLYHEVFRSDIEATVLNVGGEAHEIRFVKTFSAASDIPITAFSNQGLPILNEVGIFMVPSGDPADDVAAPNPTNPQEALFAMRTFKSVPFDASDDIALTVRYTIYIE